MVIIFLRILKMKVQKNNKTITNKIDLLYLV